MSTIRSLGQPRAATHHRLDVSELLVVHALVWPHALHLERQLLHLVVGQVVETRRRLLLVLVGRGDVRLPVGVLPQDHEALQHRRDRNVLLGGELGALLVREQHWRGVGRETRDRLGLSSLSHDVHRLPDTHADGQRLQLLVQRDEHARLHRRRDHEHQVVVLPEDDPLEVEAGVHHGQNPRKRSGRGQQPVRVLQGQRHQPLPHVQQALRDPNHEERVVRVLPVVGRKLTQKQSNARVVGARPHKPQSHDSTLSHLGIAIVRQLAQHVDDRRLWV
mmetsp:Transcript_2560/g.4642  ORF Transcript_2560/g.4642 Transcript_2560/m.4642 type:complete len:276 (-) Transcript_2560:391-1218(-)